MKTKISKIPRFNDRGIHVEILQKKLIDLGFNIDGLDGIFGSATQTALKKFQRSVGLSDTGVINPETLTKLDFEIKVGNDSNQEIAILDIVDKKDITNTVWRNRGKAAWGFYHGMALMYASLHQRLKNGDPTVKEMAKVLSHDIDKDALKRFDNIFLNLGMNNSNSEVDRLRHLIVLMFGLGVMESNGKHCAGRDITMNFDHGDDTEAGLFQTSYNVRSVAKTVLNNIFDKYKKSKPSGFLQYFRKGFEYYHTKNYGEGDAKEFQKLSKECPAFSIEFTAIALRNISNHWAPVKHFKNNTRGLQINIECNELLKEVQAYVDEYGFSTEEIDLNISISGIDSNFIVNVERDELKKVALNNAIGIGQERQLKKLFDNYNDSNANYWVVIDFNKPSSEKRMFIFDLANGDYKSYLVSHGKNSGDLYATNFSNEIGSNKSCLGIFRTAETYFGKHGLSLRLDGKEHTNSNTRIRAIVIHKADYVVPNYKGTGRAGRSEGCFAVNPTEIDEVIDNLKNGSYIIAWSQNS